MRYLRVEIEVWTNPETYSFNLEESELSGQSFDELWAEAHRVARIKNGINADILVFVIGKAANKKYEDIYQSLKSVGGSADGRITIRTIETPGVTEPEYWPF